MKTLLLTISILCTYISIFAQIPERSKIDVLNYRIKLTVPDIENPFIRGSTEINLTIQHDDMENISLDLADLKVDSIYYQSKSVKEYFRYRESIKIPLPIKSKKNERVQIIIYYHGKPTVDRSWGGFYFSENTAFNMGVGMQSNPQVFGRTWFACNDTLCDKATYRFEISTQNNLTAVCSGMLDSVKTINHTTTTYYWSAKLPISTYLASVSISNYSMLETTFIGIEKEIPIQWYVKTDKKEATKKSFIHINNAMQIFEKYYGAYPWNRVGFVSVPFKSGAMEHAENIALPDYAFDGTLHNEHLWVHELSHSWFGNLVTCEKPEDMWLNEGWATYSEALFMQKTYGETSYKNYVRQNHKTVLTQTHIYDNGYRSAYGNTGDYTYGSTVYDKGADVVHCLRNYGSDSLFFEAVSAYLKKYAYSTSSTQNLIKIFNDVYKTDLSDFFENWIYKPGFPHFRAEISEITKKDTDFLVKVRIKQHFTGRNFYSNNNPIEVTFFDKDMNDFSIKANASGESTNISVHVPFKPVCIILDKDEKVSDATIDNFSHLSKNETIEFPDVDFKCIVEDFKDKAIIQAILNLTSPEKTISEKYRLSKNAYWTITGFAQKLKAEGIFNVDKSLHGFTCAAEKLCLLYRSTEKTEWKPIKYTTTELNSNTLNIYVPNLLLGDYVLAELK